MYEGTLFVQPYLSDAYAIRLISRDPVELIALLSVELCVEKRVVCEKQLFSIPSKNNCFLNFFRPYSFPSHSPHVRQAR